MRIEKQLDLGWMPEPTPIALAEDARRKLVRLMAAALVTVCASVKEGADDERDAPEDLA
jgi:hypothetical protein